MLGNETTRLFKTVLETISEVEIIVEGHRQALCSIPSFAPYSAFCRIDRGAQECIDARAILEFLRENSAAANIGDCARLVRFFDSDEDGFLSYADFIQIVLPCDDNLMRAQVQKRPYSRVGRFDSLSYDIEMGLVRLLQHEVDFLRRMNALTRDLGMRPDYSTFAAFRTVDRYNEGTINVVNLQDFFRAFGNYLVESEVFAIVRRIDTDGDARLCFEEFADFFKVQVNQETAMHPQPPARGQGMKTRKIKSAGRHRGEMFATGSTLGSNIERSLMQSGVGQSLQVSPQQKNPVRKVHFSSPLRATKSAMKDYSSRMSPSVNMTRSTQPNTNSSYVSRRFDRPVQQESEAGVVKMISEQVHLDKNVEMSKNETVARPDFNSYDAFRMFDIDNLGTVTALDMQHGLADIGVHVTTDDVNLFFERYDKNRDGRLDYREFAAALTPEDPYYAQMLARRPSSHKRINIYRKDDVFAYPTAGAFKNLLRTMISSEGASEATRQTLSRNPYFNPDAAFNMVDFNANGIVSKDEIRYMMESKGHFISDREARQVAQKMDQNRDGVITYNEFAESVRPKSPSRRM